MTATSHGSRYIILLFIYTEQLIQVWVSLQNLIDNLLKHGDYNVIVVHWPGGSSIPYTTATANTRIVGLETAHLVNTLVVSAISSVPSLHNLISNSSTRPNAGLKRKIFISSVTVWELTLLVTQARGSPD